MEEICIEENGNMAIIKKSFGKNYLRCYENEKEKIYSCEQIRKSWHNKVNYVTENSANFRFSEEQLVKWSWDKVDISKESQGVTKDKDSIQYFTIQKLLGNQSYEIIFDDDNAGEIADIVAIQEKDKEICFEFYHCKFAHGAKAGSRVADLKKVI